MTLLDLYKLECRRIYTTLLLLLGGMISSLTLSFFLGYSVLFCLFIIYFFQLQLTQRKMDEIHITTTSQSNRILIVDPSLSKKMIAFMNSNGAILYSCSIRKDTFKMVDFIQNKTKSFQIRATQQSTRKFIKRSSISNNIFIQIENVHITCKKGYLPLSLQEKFEPTVYSIEFNPTIHPPELLVLFCYYLKMKKNTFVTIKEREMGDTSSRGDGVESTI
ncbi:hypothetical protein Q75_07950 [Bacillus coahuilensis p1.1.43]|uniref:Uncharacterized protein n=1 Tax=Bacillus coahuilensis p1.1.43 TaxID=1150625 RepID=A0A147K8J3_9BACI|nr:hypothetical protein [Bacillus coahuilensis]KUP06457.1 hypothetical protein Q75_07950 [Bacillus coahuilensis p1.1.43]